MPEVVVFLVVAVAMAVIGIRLGMLFGPRLGRLLDRAGGADEETDPR